VRADLRDGWGCRPWRRRLTRGARGNRRHGAAARESIQKAAIAIDAQSGDTLLQEGINKPEDLSKLVPALSFAAGGGNNSSIFMRGVGTRTNNAYLDTAIAISYDGVFMAQPPCTLFYAHRASRREGSAGHPRA
jgi:hypothetical protein